MALKYTFPLRWPSESLQGLAAALSKNLRDFEGFLNSTVIRKDADGSVNLPNPSYVGGFLIPTELDHLTDVTVTLPVTKHVLVHNGTKFVNRVLTEDDIFDHHPPPPLPITIYIESPHKSTTEDIHGDIESLATAQPLDSVPTDLVVTVGIQRIFVMVIAGSDVSGSITVTGTSVDRVTGVETGSDTEVLTVTGVSTDGNTTDANGNNVWDMVGGYMTAKWFTGTVTLSTADLTLTDVDVYGTSFEQMGDDSSFQLDIFDCGLFSLNAAAEFDAYLFIVETAGGGIYDITALADVHLGAVGTTAVANRHYRLRRGNLAKTMDGSAEGWFLQVTFANSPAYIEDVYMTIWDIHPI